MSDTTWIRKGCYEYVCSRNTKDVLSLLAVGDNPTGQLLRVLTLPFIEVHLITVLTRKELLAVYCLFSMW